MVQCRVCNRANEDHYRFCLGCGNQLLPPEAAERDRPDGQAVPSPAVAGAGVGPRSRSGSPPPSSFEARRTCGRCGAEVLPQYVFCSNCGTRFGGASPREAVSASTPKNSPSPVSGGVPDVPTPFRSRSSAPAMGTLAFRTDSIPMPGMPIMARLHVVNADGSEGEAVPLPLGDTRIGRGTGLPFLAGDPFLSPDHAVFSVSGQRLTVRDAGSLNGVFRRITGPVELRDGDVFRVGQQLLRFEEMDPALEVAPVADGTYPFGSPEAGTWGRLSQVIGPGATGDSYLLRGEEVVLGRERGDILFPDDPYVSASHCRIALDATRRVLADLGSSNGTYLRLRGEVRVDEGDVFLLGQQIFVLRAGVAAS